MTSTTRIGFSRKRSTLQPHASRFHDKAKAGVADALFWIEAAYMSGHELRPVAERASSDMDYGAGRVGARIALTSPGPRHAADRAGSTR